MKWICHVYTVDIGDSNDTVMPGRWLEQDLIFSGIGSSELAKKTLRLFLGINKPKVRLSAQDNVIDQSDEFSRIP